MLGFSFAKRALTRDNSSLHVVATEKVVSEKQLRCQEKQQVLTQVLFALQVLQQH